MCVNSMLQKYYKSITKDQFLEVMEVFLNIY